MGSIRVLISKVGLDGHERGATVLSKLLMEEGMEVVYLGKYQTPASIVNAAIEEDVDVIGLSILSGEHLTFVPKVEKLMRANRLEDRLFLVGGTIPVEDIPVLKSMGVDEIFTAGSLIGPITEYIRENVRKSHKGD